jgi:D-sedoheptulose 7-phosphate isomerase
MTLIDPYFKKYFELLKNNIASFEDYKSELDSFIQQLDLIRNSNAKIVIAGNGGSAAIASHFSVDMVKVGKIRCTNFNEPSLITCFSNDYGYENWLQKAIEVFTDNSDLVILISSRGESKNIINAATWLKSKGIRVVTFTGFSVNNTLKGLGDINFWTNCSSYNIVEITHLTWLLSIIDKISLGSEIKVHK